MPRAVDELKEIPFGLLIGQPLKAAIEAQGLAARATVDFIEKVGFIPPDPNQSMLFIDETKDADAGKLRNVTFTYKKRDENNVETDVTLTVPVLSIVPIPFVRLDEITIDFTAKLNDTLENTSKTNFALNSSVSGQYKSWWSPISLEFRTSMSYQTATSTAAKYTRDYTMQIHVRAVQDDIPAGLSKVLDILGNAIKEKKTT